MSTDMPVDIHRLRKATDMRVDIHRLRKPTLVNPVTSILARAHLPDDGADVRHTMPHISGPGKGSR